MTMIKSCRKTLFFALLAAVVGACASTKTPEPTVSLNPAEVTARDEAIRHYRQLIQEHPGKIEGVLGLARNLRWMGRLEEADGVLADARVRFSSDARFLAELGKIRLTQGHSIEGVELLSRATQGEPRDWRLYSALGIGNDYLERYAAAEAAYKKALALCPDDAAVMNNLGISQALSGRLDEGIETLRIAFKQGPHREKIKRNLTLFEGARALCATCSTDYLRQTGGEILAAGLMGTDSEGPCAPTRHDTAASSPVMAERLASDSASPSINIKVFFEFDSAILKPEALDVLDNLGTALTSEVLEAYRFEIAGHTDAVGTEIYNQELSERRAQAVQEYLVMMFDIDPARIKVVGYGESRLLTHDNPEGDVNRRVQVTRLERL